MTRNVNDNTTTSTFDSLLRFSACLLPAPAFLFRSSPPKTMMMRGTTRRRLSRLWGVGTAEAVVVQRGTRHNTHHVNVSPHSLIAVRPNTVSSRWFGCGSGNGGGASSIDPSSPSEQIGLFSIPGLCNPSDFHRLTKEAILESDRLRGSIPVAFDTKSQAVETLYQLDQISKTVCNVIDAAELCRSAHASVQWRDAANTAFVELQNYIGSLNTDQRLYNSLALIEHQYFKDLTEEERRFCFLLKREFELDGIHLADEERDNVRTMRNHVSTLETLFTGNIIQSQKSFWVDADLVEAVMPKHVLQANGAVYDPNGEPGRVQLTADTPITHSLSTYAANGTLRRDVYMETTTTCPENHDVLDAMIHARHRLAQSLGFQSYSHRFLQDKMAKSPENVMNFLNDLQRRIQPEYHREMTQIAHVKQQLEGSSIVEPWDLKYYVKLLKTQSGADADELAPYLSLSNCLEATQFLVHQLFGIQMEETELQEGERWDIDDDGNGPARASKDEHIRKFIFREDEEEERPDGGGGGGRDLGVMYLDLHPRPGKYTHAAHFTVRCGCVVDGPGSEYQLPIVALVCNMNQGQASFSSHQEVETFFHEFGHALHSLLSRTQLQHLSGTRAAMDFVETPSHWMEHYAWDTNFLPILAKNKNGEPLPAALAQALSQSRNQFRYLEMQSQLILASFDQVIFGGDQGQSVVNPMQAWESIHRQKNVPFATGTHWYTNVGHLVTYGAGYYCYLYSQVFANGIWDQLFREQCLSRQSGEKMWKNVLIYGGARDANVMLEDLLGRKPTVDNFFQNIPQR